MRSWSVHHEWLGLKNLSEDCCGQMIPVTPGKLSLFNHPGYIHAYGLKSFKWKMNGE
jgi:hypothetical protein